MSCAGSPRTTMTIVDNNSVQVPYQVDKLSCMVKDKEPKTTTRAPLRSDCRKALPYILMCRIRVSARSHCVHNRIGAVASTRSLKLEEYTTLTSV